MVKLGQVAGCCGSSQHVAVAQWLRRMQGNLFMTSSVGNAWIYPCFFLTHAEEVFVMKVANTIYNKHSVY
jgi:hypothetical protein